MVRGGDPQELVMNPVRAVLRRGDALLLVTPQPGVHALPTDPIPLGDLGHRIPAQTSRTARYLCSVTVSSHSVRGRSSIKRSHA
jgi:hypothetical protein